MRPPKAKNHGRNGGAKRGKRRGGEGSRFQGGQTFPNGIFNEIGKALKTHFFHNLAAVGFYRLEAEVDSVGDFSGNFTLGIQLEDFPFPGG